MQDFLADYVGAETAARLVSGAASLVLSGLGAAGVYLAWRALKLTGKGIYHGGAGLWSAAAWMAKSKPLPQVDVKVVLLAEAIGDSAEWLSSDSQTLTVGPTLVTEQNRLFLASGNKIGVEITDRYDRRELALIKAAATNRRADLKARDREQARAEAIGLQEPIVVKASSCGCDSCKCHPAASCGCEGKTPGKSKGSASK